MTGYTKSVLAAIFKGDPTITTEQQEAALLALNTNPAAGDGAPDPGRVLRPKEVAERLGICRKTLSVYAADKKSRRLGYTEASVRAFINGRT